MTDTSVNPYESPLMGDAALDGSETPGRSGAKPAADGLAGTASIYRLAAAIADHFVATLLFFVTAMSLTNAGSLHGLSLVAGAVVWLSYFFLTEWLLGATPGKLLTGLRVRQETGERCTAGQIAVRTLLRIVEVNPLVCGLFPAGIAVNCTARRQRIGDLMAGTVVVHKSQLRPPVPDED